MLPIRPTSSTYPAYLRRLRFPMLPLLPVPRPLIVTRLMTSLPPGL